MITASLYRLTGVIEYPPIEVSKLTISEVRRQMPVEAAELLNCHPSLVDVLAAADKYIIYSVFDCEGELNETAMHEASRLTGIAFDSSSEDVQLRGPILILYDEE